MCLGFPSGLKPCNITVKFYVYLLSSTPPREDKVAPYSMEMERRRSFGSKLVVPRRSECSGFSKPAQKIVVFTRTVLMAIVVRVFVPGSDIENPQNLLKTLFCSATGQEVHLGWS